MVTPWFIIDAASTVHRWPKLIMAHLRGWAVQHGGRVVEASEIDTPHWQEALADPDQVIALVAFGGLPDGLQDRFPAVPCLNLSANWRVAGMVHVVSDSAAAGRVAARHLLDEGLRRFVVHGRGSGVELERRDGFVDEVSGHGCEAAWQPVLARAYDCGALPDVGGERLGIMCTGDDIAARICEGLIAGGYRIPDDVALVSIEDIEATCQSAAVAISSVNLRPETIAERVGELARSLRDGADQPPEDVRVPCGEVTRRASTATPKRDDPIVSLALALISKRFAGPLTVDDLALACRVTPKTLTRHFAANRLRSPGATIRQRRLQKAQRLLRDSDDSLEAIARACGFQHGSNLSRSFSRAFAMSPKQWRRAHRSQD